MACLPRAQASSKKRARNVAAPAVIIQRCVFPAILFFPWCCQSLLAKFKVGRFRTPVVPSPPTHATVGETEFTPLTANNTKLSLGRTEQGCCSDGDHNEVIDPVEKQQRSFDLNQPQIFLFSLNWIRESDSRFYRKKDIRRLWEWKDIALGDGRDFFVPKPKTLMALQEYLLENIPNLSECSIISNCARLEVLCCCSSPIPTYHNYTKKDRTAIEYEVQDVLARDISHCFVAQLNNYQNVSKNANAWTRAMMQLPINADRPESVLTTAPPTADTLESIAYYDSWWNVTVGTEAILTRVCKVSAGMGHRPRRPDRPVVFRPFSSRDAHVLLQLKRTRENIAFSSDSCQSTDGNSRSINDTSLSNNSPATPTRQQRKRKYLPVILDCALRAGKAARNSAIVPEIEELRKMTSAESSACSPSDLKISQRVSDAAFEKGILPLVKECAMKLDHSTQSIDQRISEFRRNAMELLLETESAEYDDNSFHRELRSWLNRRLHEPTIELRSRSQRRSTNDDDDDDDDIDSYLRQSLDQIRREFDIERRRIQERVDERTIS